jgi:hypothetical protein
MTTPQIHASLEEAQMLKNAGWEKPCVHYAIFETEKHHSHDYIHRVYCYAYNISIAQYFDVDSDIIFEGKLYMPTLGEIELPEAMVIYYRKHSGWFYGQVLWYNLSSYEVPYKTELSARIHAWVWAKENGLV